MSHLETRQTTHDVLGQIADDYLRRDLACHATDLGPHDGRIISIGQRDMVNFGSCSYLGLEKHPALIEGVVQAVQTYGTQFSSSRAFVSVGLYTPLEARLSQIFHQPVVVTPSTTLGHFAALPVLVDDQDAVVLDLQVHHSVQTAAQQLKARGIPIHIIRHNDMDHLERKIRQLRGRHRKVWYFADGVYSMYGDFAPLDALYALMDRYPCFRLYIDDAHGMSWCGPHGCGYVRSEKPHHPQMLLAVSLNKAFASAGGALVCPDEQTAHLVRTRGGPMIFSGPIQPPMLGAALASAQLHLSEEIVHLQRTLADLVSHTNEALLARGLPQFAVTSSPVFFIPMGLPRVVAGLVRRMHDEGHYVNSATFPATPMRQGGLRFMMNCNLIHDDVDALVDCVHRHYLEVLHEEGSSPEQVARVFGIEPFSVRPHEVSPGKAQPGVVVEAPVELEIEHTRSISEIEPELWGTLFSGRGNITHSSLQMLEACFTQADVREHCWDFHYLIVRDQAGEVVLATFFTCALVKDDMLAEAAVSEQVEQVRRHDPYYLTSRTVMLGCLISRGCPLYLKREHPEWKRALRCLLETLNQTAEASGARQVMVREFETGADPELRQFMLDHGLIDVHAGDALVFDDLGWADHDAYLARLGQKYRYNVRREVLPYISQFEVTTERPGTPEELEECYALYSAVFARSFALNVFKLPQRLFDAMARHPEYEVLRLYLRADPRPPSARTPVAVMYTHLAGGTCSALVVGLDDAFIRSHNTYKQALYQTVQRAWSLQCDRLDLAFTATLEKKKLGARPRATSVFVESKDIYSHAVLEHMAR
ncbi:MAG: aminotransferase class I/II-fold pyridoxal phosphate-dependent enzyme [Bradymonadia bacterium]